MYLLVVGYLTTLSISRLHSIAWYDELMNLKIFGRGKSGSGLIKIIFRHLPGGTGENHEES
jgi:hypothetical protein